MRQPLAAFCLTLFLALPALAATTPDPKAQALSEVRAVERTTANADIPNAADVREYIKLFGYREMLEVEAHRKLDNMVTLARLSHSEFAPDVFDVIGQELGAELATAADEAERQMVEVFQRRFTKADVAYLIGVGRDPRMQKVVRLQTAISKDMEAVGERLAESVTAKAGPRIEERLKLLQGGRQL